MGKKRKVTAAEEKRYADLRKKVEKEFPPKRRRKKASPRGNT